MWHVNLYVRIKTVIFLEENIGESLCYFWLGRVLKNNTKFIKIKKKIPCFKDTNKKRKQKPYTKIEM